MRGYKYRPLRSPENIRLLCLEPGYGLEPLRGCLIENRSHEDQRLGFRHKYEALSYTWGSPGDKRILHLDGYGTEITRSLQVALLNLRSPEATMNIWIDQICINQCDDGERSSQVQQMLRVYASAERVQVWLGTSTEHSNVGMMLLQQHCYNRQLGHDPYWKDLAPDMVRTGIEDIINRSWFHRTWVIQEAAVAREVMMHCGKQQFAWHNTIEQVRFFSRAIKSTAWTQTELKDANLDVFLQVLQRQLDNGPEKTTYKTNTVPYDLLDIAYEMRNRNSADPRDRIYAMLGFADEDTQNKLRPDYAMSVEELFKRFEEVLLYGSSNQSHTSEGTAQPKSGAPERGMLDWAVSLPSGDPELVGDLLEEVEQWDVLHCLPEELHTLQPSSVTLEGGSASTRKAARLSIFGRFQRHLLGRGRKVVQF